LRILKEEGRQSEFTNTPKAGSMSKNRDFNSSDGGNHDKLGDKQIEEKKRK
jgi:hypothetical protein